MTEKILGNKCPACRKDMVPSVHEFAAGNKVWTMDSLYCKECDLHRSSLEQIVNSKVTSTS